jgi:hypothetical protein
MARINSGNEKASTYDDRTVPIFGTRPTDDTAVFEYMSLNHHPDAPGLLSWGLLVKRLWPEQARLDHNEKKSCLRPENMPFVNEKRSMEYGSFFPTPAATISLPSVLLLFPQFFIRYLAPWRFPVLMAGYRMETGRSKPDPIDETDHSDRAS